MFFLLVIGIKMRYDTDVLEGFLISLASSSDGQRRNFQINYKKNSPKWIISGVCQTQNKWQHLRGSQIQLTPKSFNIECSITPWW